MEIANLGTRAGGNTIGSLREGERTRLQLAIASMRAPEVLIIDQPTYAPVGSEVSLDDVNALSNMIAKFPKTCVVNSSDTSFLNTFTNSVLYVDQGGDVEQLNCAYSAAQDTLAARHQAVAGPAVVKMSFKQKAGWFALLLPVEILLCWMVVSTVGQ